jgi:hypothetical protein
MRTDYAMTSCEPLLAVAARSTNQSRSLRMTVSRRASACTAAAVFSIANVLAAAAGAATERVGSFGLRGNTGIGSGKFWSLLLAWSSALAVALLRARMPELQPLLEASASRPATKPRPVEVNRD